MRYSVKLTLSFDDEIVINADNESSAVDEAKAYASNIWGVLQREDDLMTGFDRIDLVSVEEVEVER